MYVEWKRSGCGGSGRYIFELLKSVVEDQENKKFFSKLVKNLHSIHSDMTGLRNSRN